MDRLEGMSIVLAVAEAGSLSAAARRLNTPVATASRKITELEEHLRAKLFDRTARKLTLTDAGLSYVAALKRILADLSEADRAAAGEYMKPTGELIVTAPVGLGRLHLIPILAEFLRAYPDIVIRLVLADPILGLPEDHIDVALRTGELPDKPAHRAAARHHPRGRVREPRLSGGTRDAEDAPRSCGARLHRLRPRFQL